MKTDEEIMMLVKENQRLKEELHNVLKLCEYYKQGWKSALDIIELTENLLGKIEPEDKQPQQ